MPPLPAVDNVFRLVTLCAGNDGRSAVNVMHFTYGGPSPASYDFIETCADNWWGQWVSNMIPKMPAQTSLVSVTAIDLQSDTAPAVTYDGGGTPVPGTSSHGMLPLSTAFLVSKFVERRWRGGHPRSYLPIGTTDDLNDDGDWKADSVTALLAAYTNSVQDFIDATVDGSNSVGLECCVTYKSKNLNPTPPYDVVPPYVTTIPVDGYSAGPKLATQRKRVRRVARRR